MFCNACGAAIQPEDRFCSGCGATIGRDAGISPPAVDALPPYYRAEFQRIRDTQERYKGCWNWAAFFGGGFWAFARGLHKYGWFYLLVFYVLAWPVAVVLHIVLGSRANHMLYGEWRKQKHWPVRSGYGFRECWRILNTPISKLGA